MLARCCAVSRASQQPNHQGKGLLSRKNPPVGPLSGRVAAHISGDPAWAHCVHQDSRATEFTGKRARQGIEAGFRDLISRRSGAHICERTRFR